MHVSASRKIGRKRREIGVPTRAAQSPPALDPSRVATAVAIAVAAMVLVSLAVAGQTALAFRNLERRRYAGLAAESKLRLDRLIERDRARMMEVGSTTSCTLRGRCRDRHGVAVGLHRPLHAAVR
ncbi:MAG: hypothetical protein R2882_00860 [Gemmatimonadales bacterium]